MDESSGHNGAGVAPKRMRERKSPALAAALNCMPVLAFAICWAAAAAVVAGAGNPSPSGCGQESGIGLVVALLYVFALFSGGYGYLYLGGGTRFAVAVMGLPGILVAGLVSLGLIDHLTPGLFFSNCSLNGLAAALVLGAGLIYALATVLDAWLVATKQNADSVDVGVARSAS